MTHNPTDSNIAKVTAAKPRRLVEPRSDLPSSKLSAAAVAVLIATRRLGARLVEVLEELVGGELDAVVSPLRRPIQIGDQAHAMAAPEVPIANPYQALMSSCAP
jgi:hypothetical protein